MTHEASRDRIPAIDGLRGICVILVMVSHLGVRTGGSGVISRFHAVGHVGVWILFAISGFVITRVLIDEQRRRDTVSLAEFWSRRALRVFPTLLAFLQSSYEAAAIHGAWNREALETELPPAGGSSLRR